MILFKILNQIIGINGQPNPNLGFSKKKKDLYQKLVWTLMKDITFKNKVFYFIMKWKLLMKVHQYC